MRLIDAYEKIAVMDQAVIRTNQVATLLNISSSNASHILQRLQTLDKVIGLQRGIWALPEKLDQLTLPMYLTRPDPSYISLQSALYFHGIIEQIPEQLYAVTSGRTKLYKTPIITVSVHHIHPELFFGFEIKDNPMLRIATAEKAMVDFLYLLPAKSRKFVKLPEIDWSLLNKETIQKIIKKIPYASRRQMVMDKFSEIAT